MTLQQGFTGGEPTVTLSNEPSKSAHTPNLSASLGHFPLEGLGTVGFGFGFGFGRFGLGLGEGQPPPQAVAREKKRRLKARKRARDVVLLGAISLKR
jgi:hypothetical protein